MSEQLLFPEHEWDYVDRAVERVKIAWGFHHMMNPNGEKMLLAFSGGKDSICLFFVCKQAAEELGVPMETMFHVQYNITNVDPPELVRFIRDVMKKEYPFIELHHPKKNYVGAYCKQEDPSDKNCQILLCKPQGSEQSKRRLHANRCSSCRKC